MRDFFEVFRELHDSFSAVLGKYMAPLLSLFFSEKFFH